MSLPESVGTLLGLALSEDLGETGDITSRAFIPEASRSKAQIVAREDCIASGLEVAMEVFRRVDPTLEVTPRCAEGDLVAEGSSLIDLHGSSRSILSGERTALNFL
ncbi:MAG: nicotinate-nucleotide diphosphorylase (carboxylating), partial [Proteobacteria bacterium]|nr:nicotinate-nucleotide diphosphorylase (carboxylating) [Pseudomonadota bacterium]